MKYLFFILFLVGCTEEDGIWLSESCLNFEDYINDTVDKYNDLVVEDSKIILLGVQYSDPSQNRNKALNDDSDFFYCLENADNRYIKGTSNLGYGDIYLYPDNFENVEFLQCTILHELGHRFLSFEHSVDKNTIMYKLVTEDCLEKMEWL